MNAKNHNPPSPELAAAIAAAVNSAKKRTPSTNPFFSEDSVSKGPAISSREDVPPDEIIHGKPARDYTDDLRYQDVEDRSANRALRQRFAEKAYKVAKYGLYWWAVVLLLSAVGKVCKVELFSDNVLIAVTSASTLNLFAAFLGVIRGLFPNSKAEKE
ncbi:hypothetical protein ACU81H_004778 [Salmonella enterica]|uniref:hypothetical protein n=1 Tax=Salmonella enterica TaxID=28901 RepID=UPI0020CB4B48|nr:hypothetical protein [Salmonella enterica]